MVLESVWDAIIDDPGEPKGLKRRSDYLILIQARLHGHHDDGADNTKCCGLPIDQVHDLMEGKIDKFSLSELTAIARKIGITTKV